MSDLGEVSRSDGGGWGGTMRENCLVMEADVKELEERIVRDGKNLGGGILKVDSFVNHQVDPLLMDACGREFARRFAPVHATKVLTAEISGIAPALTTAIHL